jgi:pimeloyl-ACP methyl ester carboxylesterase
MSRTAPRAAGPLVAAVLALLALGGAAPAAAAPDPAWFDHQTIAWHGCAPAPDAPPDPADPTGEIAAALDQFGAQCGEVVVPLDYSHPDGPRITVALSRLVASDPDRRGVLFLNAGGPGELGLPLVLAGLSYPAFADVAPHYDLIGMDPRFVGHSTPITCPPSTGFFDAAGPDHASFVENATRTKAFALGCAAGHEEQLPHASTRNTARDMDVVRAALGEQKISYLGFSYGTYLGQVYLQMFGEHADRVVLDSAIDPDAYGPDLTRSFAEPTQAALEHWAGFAAARDSTYHLGATTEDVLRTVDRIAAAANRGPLRVGDLRVDAHTLPGLLLLPLNNDSPDNYAAITADVRVLADAADGEDVVPTPTLVQHLGPTPLAGLQEPAILCADGLPHSRDPEAYFADIEAHRATEPLFGPLARTVNPCVFWPTAPAEPPTTIDNAVPALVVGSTGDPRTPIAGQKHVHELLSGSRMVTVPGSFRHIVYVGAVSACAEAAVNHYLLDGVLPDHDITCTDGESAP